MSIFKRLLIYRFILFNALLIAAVGILTYLEFILPLFTNDVSYISYAIVGLFTIGWGWTLKECIKLSRLLDTAKVTGYPYKTVYNRDKAAVKVEWLESISEWLVGLGLLGTVIGFSIALSGIDQTSLMQAQGAQSSVGTLMSGMRIALNTTLLGASLAIWHQINLRMFRTTFISYWLDCLKESK